MEHTLVLEGHGFRLEPLAVAHVGALAASVDDAMWSGMSTPTPRGELGMANYVEDTLAMPDCLAFAVIDQVSGEVRGSTAFCALSHDQGRVEVGRTFYDRRVWGRVINPACKFLLLEHAFSAWGLFRVALRADSRNTRSIAAITRLGATYEGTLRGYRLAPDGSRADSLSFSILEPDWPGVRAGLLARVDPLRQIAVVKDGSRAAGQGG